MRHLQQISASVIAHWLKSRDVSVVQHMAGHKWVSSTERYQQTDLQDLERNWINTICCSANKESISLPKI